MNLSNNCTFRGRLPKASVNNPNAWALDYRPSNAADRDNSMFRATLSVRRAYKAKGEKFAKEDKVRFVAFGREATYLHEHAEQGDTLEIHGEFQQGDPYQGRDGQKHEGTWELHVDQADIIKKGEGNTLGTTAGGATAPAVNGMRPAVAPQAPVAPTPVAPQAPAAQAPAQPQMQAAGGYQFDAAPAGTPDFFA